jgi:hypothetical protein
MQVDLRPRPKNPPGGKRDVFREAEMLLLPRIELNLWTPTHAAHGWGTPTHFANEL